MESLAALGLASNIIQVVDFSSRIISRGRELYNSVDGCIEDHATLDDAARNLSELYKSLSLPIENPRPRKTTEADRQLMRLKVESEQVVDDLRTALQKAKITDRNKKWQSLYQALTSVHTDKQISVFRSRLDDIRKQIDTAVLISIQESSRASRVPQEENSKDDVKRRHAEFLSTVLERNWRPSRQHDVDVFSEHMSLLAATDNETRFQKLILSRLYFRQMPSREYNIPDAHAKTFGWLFGNRTQTSDGATWGSFTEWIKEENNSIYWVTGKPGSGKSTLMKFIYHHPRLPKLLERWATKENLVTAGFYFWNSGTEMQMSWLGLLQALLHACFLRNRDLLVSAMPERWEEFLALGGGLQPFEESELRQIFDRVIADDSRQFFFLIDGLDEFKGQPKEMIEFIMRAARPNVKICVASRPWLPFEDAFKRLPSLLLERLTRKDIETYVSEHFHADEHYKKLHDYEPMAAEALSSQVVDRASGVFLWVYLVVQSLLEGLSNADRVSHLQARLDSLPSDLEDLFDVILDRLQPEYFTQACESFRLVQAHRELSYIRTQDRSDTNPTLLGLYFADDPDTKSSLRAINKSLEPQEACRRADQMRRRLIARCKGLLETYPSPEDESGFDSSTMYDNHVSYLHRTARDYVESKTYWNIVLESSGGSSFQPEQRWANANLWIKTTHPLKGNKDRARLMTRCCLEGAAAFHRVTGIVPATYLDKALHGDVFLQGMYVRNSSDIADWVLMIRDGSGLMDYWIILLARASPGCHGSLSTVTNMLLSHPKDVFEHQSVVTDNVRKAWKYYNTPISRKWLRRQPKLASWE